MTTQRTRFTSAVLLAAALVVLAGCGGSVAGVASLGSSTASSGARVESPADQTAPGESVPAEDASSGDAPSDEPSSGDAPSDEPATSQPEPSPAPEDGDSSEAAPSGTAGAVRYLAMGDSLTQGIGAADLDNGTFPALLAQRWRDAGCEVELKNVGISGYTAAQIVTDQVPEIEPFQPTVVTFQGGGNDIATGVTIDDYRTNVNAVLDATQAAGARVLVVRPERVVPVTGGAELRGNHPGR